MYSLERAWLEAMSHCGFGFECFVSTLTQSLFCFLIGIDGITIVPLLLGSNWNWTETSETARHNKLLFYLSYKYWIFCACGRYMTYTVFSSIFIWHLSPLSKFLKNFFLDIVCLHFVKFFLISGIYNCFCSLQITDFLFINHSYTGHFKISITSDNI